MNRMKRTLRSQLAEPNAFGDSQYDGIAFERIENSGNLVQAVGRNDASKVLLQRVDRDRFSRHEIAQPVDDASAQETRRALERKFSLRRRRRRVRARALGELRAIDRRR